MEKQVDVQKEVRKATVVAWAMVVSVLIYPLAAQIIRMRYPGFAGFASEAIAPYKDHLFLGALLAFLAIRMIRNGIMKGAPDDPQARLARLATASMISLIVSEIPAILGFVLFLTTGNTREFYVMVALSLVAVILYYPKPNHWEVWIRKKMI